MSNYSLPELNVMDQVRTMLLPLNNDERRRVLAWLSDYVTSPDQEQTAPAATSVFAGEEPAVSFDANDSGADYADDEYDEFDDYEDEEEDAVEEDDGEFHSLSEFYFAINPRTARQKTATVGWWLETQEGMETWRTFDISKALKGMGKPVRYLSTTIAQEKKKADPMVEQVSKSGESVQSHGAFRLTENGKAYVEGRLAELGRA